MKLLSDIVNDLVDDSISLQRPLLKMKVLASRVKNKNLLAWVTSELEGYKGEDTPSYRKTMSNIIGSYINGRSQFTNAAIPVLGLSLSEEMEKFLMTFELPSGMQTIEAAIEQNDSGKVVYGLPAELQKIIETKIKGNGNPYFQLIEIHKETSIGFLVEIIANVRSKLLDFALQLEQEFGVEVDIVALSKNDHTINDKITSIMNQTIINTTGHGNVITTGNENEINNNSKVNVSDFESLKNHLKENGVEESDIKDLQKVIDKDNFNLEEKKFGTGVNDWTKKMLGKAVDGSWKISLAIAGKLLADALQSYYGWK